MQSRAKWKRRWFPLFCGGFIVAVYLTSAAKIWAVLPEMNDLQANALNQPFLSDAKVSTMKTRCKTVLEHMQGHWQHHFAFPGHIFGMLLTDPSIKKVALPVTDELLNDPSIQSIYLSEEIDWFHGQGLPLSPMPHRTKGWDFHGKYHCRQTQDTDKDRGISYLSTIGNQCGCGSTHFQPSHSHWLYGSDGERTASNNYSATIPEIPEYAERDVMNILTKTNPSLRLAHHFAGKNQKLCFAGDSIDFQFYSALKNNLHRAELLHQKHFKTSILNISSHRFPISYSTPSGGDPSKGYRLHDGDWRLAREVFETRVTFHHHLNKTFRFRYIQLYGWAPWLFEHMDACDVIIMNLAVHYIAFGDFYMGTGHTLFDDTQAAITFLANFSASQKNRTAIWRSALPQHFDTPNGHFPSDGNVSQTPCLAIQDDYSRKEGNEAQEYNKVHSKAFASLCHTDRSICETVQYTCTVNTKAMEFRTVYFYWVANNLTAALEHAKRDTPNVTGSILLWHLFDLFNVPIWHPSDRDCSHFCYVPALYEAAFQRLELLLLIA